MTIKENAQRIMSELPPAVKLVAAAKTRQPEEILEAIEAGIKKVIVPKSNVQDIVIDKKKLETIKIIPVDNISEVLKEALDWKGKQQILNKIMKSNGKQ